MKALIRQIGLLISFALFSTAALAADSNLVTAERFDSAKAASITTVGGFGEVPASVLGRNFREWRPPRPVPMYRSYARADVAWTNGTVIFYNPWIWNQLPPKVAAFFLAHEYGHVYQRTGNEIASDQFAARVYAQTDMSVVRSAIWHMANVQTYSSDATHPPGWQRAYIIGYAAGLSRWQIEAVMRGQF